MDSNNPPNGELQDPSRRLGIEAAFRIEHTIETTAYPNDGRALARERLRRFRERRYNSGLTARGEPPIRPDWSRAK